MAGCGGAGAFIHGALVHQVEALSEGLERRILGTRAAALDAIENLDVLELEYLRLPAGSFERGDKLFAKSRGFKAYCSVGPFLD